MSKLKIYAFTLLQLIFSASSHAEIKRYNVEIVIFEDISSRYVDSEQWPVIIRQPVIESTVDVFPSELEPTPDASVYSLTTDTKEDEHPPNNSVINLTHDTTNILDDQTDKLKRSPLYNVLLHKSWQQVGLSDANAINIQIDTTELDNSNTPELEPDFQPTKTNEVTITSSVQGSFKLVLRRYLHIYTDLNYKRLKETFRTNLPISYDNMYNEFKIKSQRKMRSNALHYIDHPLLGILIFVNQIKQADYFEVNDKEHDVIPQHE